MKYKYLLIFEDGELKVTNEEPTQEDLNACNDGVLAIVNMENSTSYYEGVWETLSESKK